MSWSYRIATFRGINLKVHITFAFIVLMAAMNWSGAGPAGMAFGALLILLLFACVTLHEFGHAVAAQYYGIPVKEIVLLPIGGIAFLGRATRNPVQELVIAAAGPAVNVVIIALLLPVLWLVNEPALLRPELLRPEGATPSVAMALHWLLGANISLVLFNMIPAFPLDGGRILRGLLGLRMDWSRATRYATGAGQGIAMAMGTWGLFSGQFMLVVMAALIFFSAASTAAEERGHTVLSSQRVGDACNRHALVLGEGERVNTVISYLLTSYQPDFAVVRGTSLLGVVRRTQVLQALALRSGDIPVASIMIDCPRVASSSSLADVRQTMAETGSSLVAVYDGPVFVGLVNLDDIEEAETVLQFLEAGSPGRPALRRSRFAPAEA
ncbi:MAG: site-2 protease family protein [Vicinamibacterales bacterium]